VDRDLEHVRESVEGFIENYHNRCRLHSALGYRPPEEIENESEDRSGEASSGAATIRVFKTLTGNSEINRLPGSLPVIGWLSPKAEITLFATCPPAGPPPHNTPRPQAELLEAQHREPAG
jgi:hypothetical protein